MRNYFKIFCLRAANFSDRIKIQEAFDEAALNRSGFKTIYVPYTTHDGQEVMLPSTAPIEDEERAARARFYHKEAREGQRRIAARHREQKLL